MAKQVEIKMNSKGARELLLGAEVTGDMERRAKAIGAAADAASGGKHRVVVGGGKNRAHVFVTTDDDAARKGEATGRTLTKSIDAGRP